MMQCVRTPIRPYISMRPSVATSHRVDAARPNQAIFGILVDVEESLHTGCLRNFECA